MRPNKPGVSSQLAAIAHVKAMSIKFYEESTADSVKYSRIYTESWDTETSPNIPSKIITQHILLNTDSVNAVKQYYEQGKTCVLNFASYKNPGGGFLTGSIAQEEALCHESTLYNVLSNEKFKPFYEYNNQHLNRGSYKNRAIYSPRVAFVDNNKELVCKADVLTCAAPNFSVAQRYGNFTKEENSEALRSRIRFILSIMSENQVDTAILGAFGCGVFAQDPYEVATIFEKELQNIPIPKAIFTIPGGKNLEAFRKILLG
jgi:uncharacterized protein (TIGR02452 family)